MSNPNYLSDAQLYHSRLNPSPSTTKATPQPMTLVVSAPPVLTPLVALALGLPIPVGCADASPVLLSTIVVIPPAVLFPYTNPLTLPNVGDTGWLVTTDGIPVTTPRLFVIERYDVNGFVYGTVVVEETKGRVVEIISGPGPEGSAEVVGAWIWPSIIWLMAEMVDIED